MAAQEATASRSYVLPEPSPEKRRALQLELEIIELCGHLSAAEHRFLQLIAEFDRDKLWEWFGVASCAQWLTWQCGLGEVAAREHVRVARALEKLPKISAVFSRGEISYSKVRAMTRVATSKIEDTLVTVALYGTAAHVERFVRQYRRFERLEEAAQAAGRHRQRHVHFTYDEDGSLIIYAKLPPEIGEVVKKAIEAAVEELYQDGMRDRRAEAESSEGDRNESPVETRSKVSAETFPPSPPSEPSASLKSPSPGWGTRAALGTSAVEEMEGESWSDSLARRRADALRLVAERFLSGGLKRASSAADRYQVFVHIDQALLARPAGATSTDRTAGGTEPTLADYLPSVGRCELEDGQVLAIETARRLACDASLVGIVEDENGEPLNVGRKTRSISPALNRALRSRDGGCRFPGCDRRLFVEGHHVEHWVNGGETKPSNLITLCGFHHGLVHEGGFGLKGTDDGAFVFARPDGSIVEQNGRARAMLQKACRMHESGWSIGTHRRSAPDSVARRGRSDIDAAADAEQSYTDEESEQALELLASNRERGLDIDATTGRCRWTGERLDYHLAVGYMAACRDVARTQARARTEAEAEAEADLPLRG